MHSPLPSAIVDTHHHLWALAGARYAWLQGGYDADAFILGDYRALCRDYGPVELLADIDGLPVVATVHVEAERDRDEALAETAALCTLVQRARGGGPRLAGGRPLPSALVVWVDLLADDAGARLEAQLTQADGVLPVVGVRCKPRVAREAAAAAAGALADEPGTLADPRWPRGLRALAERGLIWELRVPFWHLAEAARLLERVPGLTVVVQHLGLPWDRSGAGLAVWRDGLRALAAVPGVHLKLSELGLRDRPWCADENAPLLAEAVAVFGAQRCVFGSNFPVAGLRIGYRAQVQAFADALAHLPAAQQRAIWHDNAARLYRLAPPVATWETAA